MEHSTRQLVALMERILDVVERQQEEIARLKGRVEKLEPKSRVESRNYPDSYEESRLRASRRDNY